MRTVNDRCTATSMCQRGSHVKATASLFSPPERESTRARKGDESARSYSKPSRKTSESPDTECDTAAEPLCARKPESRNSPITRVFPSCRKVIAQENSPVQKNADATSTNPAYRFFNTGSLRPVPGQE